MADLFIFPRNPLSPLDPEPAYADEYAVAKRLGEVALLDHDFLDQTVDPKRALGKRPLPEGVRAVYRGWMMTSGAYTLLYDELKNRGVSLLTDPEEYRRLHYFSSKRHSALHNFMPKSVVVSKFNPFEVVTEDDLIDWRQDCVMPELASVFGNDDDVPVPVVIKDYVKSHADYWDEACFIPDALDSFEVERVMSAFAKLSGGWDKITGGWVFREWMDFARDMTNPKAKPTEYRAIVVDGQVVGCWPRAQTLYIQPAPELLEEIAGLVHSPFFSMDFAIERHTGKWWLIECGDGQVSGLPPGSTEDVMKTLAAL